MEMIKKPVAKGIMSVAVITACALPFSVNATNGYFLPGYGAKSIGMGGAGVAYAQDAISAAANPAGISRMGFRVDVSAGIFNPVRSASVGDAVGQPGGHSVFGFNEGAESSNKFYLIPSAGFTMDFDDRLTIGVAMIGNGGMNTTYKPNFFASFFGATTRNDTLGVDFMQMLIPITAAYQVDSHNAVGLSIVPAVQTFAARGLQSFVTFNITSDPENFTNKGHDNAHGAGARVGWTGKYFDNRVTLGATYASKIYMSAFKKYKGLFAEGGGFDVPANWAWGIAVKPTEKSTITFDRQRILYSDVKSIANRGPSTPLGVLGIPAAVNRHNLLGLTDGMGFGWTDQTVYKLGVDYKFNKDWTFRAGYNYGKSPIPNDQLTFNTLAPATVEKHYAVGFTYTLDPTSEFTLAFMHAATHRQEVCGQNVVNCVAIQMHQNDLEFGYSLKF